jgi:hypothetical protein
MRMYVLMVIGNGDLVIREKSCYPIAVVFLFLDTYLAISVFLPDYFYNYI